ncbi:MAG: hypothetical protein ROR55_26275 [Devosia sp.]
MMPPILAHTVTKLNDAKGQVVVCGSHGGHYAGLLAVAAGVRAILLNNAGIGRDAAGVAGLMVCEEAGIAAAALDHMSCRIGHAGSAHDTGIVSHANTPAKAVGVAAGMSAKEAASRLASAPLAAPSTPPQGEEHRHVHQRGQRMVTVIDSVSLVRAEEDAGAIVISASHGGLVGDDPKSAGRAEAFVFAYNDAGVGLEGAGISRLPILQSRGIAAVTVDCNTARIGDGASTLNDGLISHANNAATALGAEPALPLTTFVDRAANA